MRPLYLCALGGLLALLEASGAAQAQGVLSRVPQFGEAGRPQPGISRSELARAAHTLSDRAEHFHEVARDYGFPNLARDADRFARSAEHFHQAVEGGSNFSHVLRDYRQLRGEYLQLRRTYQRPYEAHYDRHVQRDWQRLSRAFDDVRGLIEEHSTGPYAHDH